VQAVLAVQEIARNLMFVAPAGLRVVCTAQEVPFQASASGLMVVPS
jgi:hypothetical protein